TSRIISSIHLAPKRRRGNRSTSIRTSRGGVRLRAPGRFSVHGDSLASAGGRGVLAGGRVLSARDLSVIVAARTSGVTAVWLAGNGPRAAAPWRQVYGGNCGIPAPGAERGLGCRHMMTPRLATVLVAATAVRAL